MQSNIVTISDLEGIHRVRSHADDWLRHLANVDEWRIDPVTLTIDLLITKARHFEYI